MIVEKVLIDKDSNGRTHEPNLRELTAQLDDLRFLVGVMDKATRDVMDERDRRYKDQFASQEKAVALAFASGAEAVQKSDDNSQKWRDNANEWRAAMTDRETKFAIRVWVEAELKSITAVTDALNVSVNQRQGRSDVSMPLVIAIASAFGGLIVYIIQQAIK